MNLSFISCLKAKQRVSVLKEQAKAAANQIKARASSSAGSHKAKGGRNLDGGNKGAKDSKEPAKKVRKVVMVLSQTKKIFLHESVIHRISMGLENHTQYKL